MFFSISTEKFDDRFVNHKNIKGYYISLDADWRQVNIDGIEFFYKGYCDTQPLADVIQEFVEDSSPKYNGNFCLIIIKDNILTISHDLHRSFPLEIYNKKTITSLLTKDQKIDVEKIWTDSLVSLNSLDNSISVEKVKTITHRDYTAGISRAQCASEIYDILKPKSSGLDAIELPIKVFLSGGVDTTMVYSIIEDYYKNNQRRYSFVVSEHIEFTPFILKNYQNIKNLHWGYGQIQHWKTPTVLASGACGDEIFMRGPTTAAIWCAWHNFNIVEILQDTDYCYHKKYFLKEKNKKLFLEAWENRKQIQEQSHAELCISLCNNIINDHQHWHLENTLTWTPLKDIRILQAVLSMNTDDLLHQILHGSLDREIISKFNPELNDYICKHKNHDSRHNLLNYKKYMDAVNQ